MNDRPIYDIPEVHWAAFAELDYTSEDMEATMRAFNQADETTPLNLLLGVRGVILATRVRLYNFGDLQTLSGDKIEDAKTNPTWLSTEAMAIIEHLDNIQAQSNE